LPAGVVLHTGKGRKGIRGFVRAGARRHKAKRCAVGPKRRKRNDALSVKTKRCAVGSHVRKAASPGADEEGTITKTKKGKAKTPRTGWCSVHNPAAKQVRKITATLVGAMSLVPTNSIENIGIPRKNKAMSVVTRRCFWR